MLFIWIFSPLRSTSNPVCAYVRSERSPPRNDSYVLIRGGNLQSIPQILSPVRVSSLPVPPQRRLPLHWYPQENPRTSCIAMIEGFRLFMKKNKNTRRRRASLKVKKSGGKGQIPLRRRRRSLFKCLKMHKSVNT